MNGLKFIRIKLGLSQEQAAILLGISRSHVAHYERETRSLPPAALSKLVQLEIAIHTIQQGNKKAMHPDSLQRYTAIKSEMKEHAKFCTIKLQLLQRDLTVLINMHAQTTTWLQAIDPLLQELRNNKIDEIDLLWFQLQYNRTLQKLASCDEAAQLVLKTKIAMLEAEIEVHERMGLE